MPVMIYEISDTQMNRNGDMAHKLTMDAIRNRTIREPCKIENLVKWDKCEGNIGIKHRPEGHQLSHIIVEEKPTIKCNIVYI